jgi:broad specificity phosphatase PhoE
VTSWNLEKRYQGSTDIPLADQGREQVPLWRKALPPKPDFIWASPLIRARETAALLYPGQPAVVDERLREMGLGKWEGRTFAEVKAELGEPDQWHGMDYRAHGGESVREVTKRLQSWLSTLPTAPGLVGVVVTHKMAAMALYSLASGWQADCLPEVRLRFPRIHRFGWNGELSVVSLNEKLGEA